MTSRFTCAGIQGACTYDSQFSFSSDWKAGIATDSYEVPERAQTVVNTVWTAGSAVRSEYVYDIIGNYTTGGSGSPCTLEYDVKNLAETGLYYYGRRMYSPNLHIWISRDPIEEMGGLNLYAFVANSPLTYNDLLGLWGLLPPREPIVEIDIEPTIILSRMCPPCPNKPSGIFRGPKCFKEETEKPSFTVGNITRVSGVCLPLSWYRGRIERTIGGMIDSLKWPLLCEKWDCPCKECVFTDVKTIPLDWTLQVEVELWPRWLNCNIKFDLNLKGETKCYTGECQ